MSHVRRTTDCHEMFPGYDDYWYVHDHKAKEIAEILCARLIKQIEENRKEGSHVIPEHINIGEITIHARFGDVKYLDREMHFTRKTIHELDDIIDRMHNMAFLKPPTPFEREKEFRFQFTITHNNQIIEPLQRSILLKDCDELLPYVI